MPSRRAAAGLGRGRRRRGEDQARCKRGPGSGMGDGPARAALHCAASQAFLRSAFFSGICRIRLPVAAKMAFSTAGAATKIVGSPTPPQKPPDGITIVSTAGISSMRITG